VEHVPPKRVRFLIRDLVHPLPTQVLMELFRHLALEGEVEAGTTDGESTFFVVRVAELEAPVIVPQEKTRPAEKASCDQSREAEASVSAR
jgi:hypothetical protein